MLMEQKKLDFVKGKPFSGVFDVVIGSAVARTLGYQTGDKIILSHRVTDISLTKHDDAPLHW